MGAKIVGIRAATQCTCKDSSCPDSLKDSKLKNLTSKNPFSSLYNSPNSSLDKTILLPNLANGSGEKDLSN